jgi:hypothetical protein
LPVIASFKADLMYKIRSDIKDKKNNRLMRKINSRQYELTQIRQKPASTKSSIKSKKGRRFDSKLDRRGK